MWRFGKYKWVEINKKHERQHVKFLILPKKFKIQKLWKVCHRQIQDLDKQIRWSFYAKNRKEIDRVLHTSMYAFPTKFDFTWDLFPTNMLNKASSQVQNYVI